MQYDALEQQFGLESLSRRRRQHDLMFIRNVHRQAIDSPYLLQHLPQSMKWIELKRSSPVEIHESLILIQPNPADDPEAESSPVQSGHNRVDIYQIPCKIYM